MSKEKMAKPPIASFGPYTTDKNSTVEIAVWANAVTSGEREFVSHSITIKRSYRDESGVWHQSGSLRLRDIPYVVLGLNKAFEKIAGNGATSEE